MPFQLVNFKIEQKQKVALFLSRTLSYSQSQIQRLFDSNRVFLDGKLTNDKTIFFEGEVSVELFIPDSKGCQPIFQTNDFIVFDKPPFVHIHPQINYNGYTLLDEIRHYGGKDANPAHRLDRETSGLVLCGLSQSSSSTLKQLFEHRQITKTYRAIVWGKIDKKFTIDAPIMSAPKDDHSKHKVKIDKSGKVSITVVTPLFYDEKSDTTYVELEPLTGRTHQLRIHMFHVEHPIVGDPLYGPNFEFRERYLDALVTHEERIKILKSERLMLHAYSLEFAIGQKYKIFSQCSTWNNYSSSISIKS